MVTLYITGGDVAVPLLVLAEVVVGVVVLHRPVVRVRGGAVGGLLGGNSIDHKKCSNWALKRILGEDFVHASSKKAHYGPKNAQNNAQSPTLSINLPYLV